MKDRGPCLAALVGRSTVGDKVGLAKREGLRFCKLDFAEPIKLCWSSGKNLLNGKGSLGLLEGKLVVRVPAGHDEEPIGESVDGGSGVGQGKIKADQAAFRFTAGDSSRVGVQCCGLALGQEKIDEGREFGRALVDVGLELGNDDFSFGFELDDASLGLVACLVQRGNDRVEDNEQVLDVGDEIADKSSALVLQDAAKFNAEPIHLVEHGEYGIGFAGTAAEKIGEAGISLFGVDFGCCHFVKKLIVR